MPKGMGYSSGGNGKKASRKGGDKVSFATAGNVKSGAYGTVSEGKSFADYNFASKGTPGNVAGHHRRTRSIGKVRGHHRGG